ncbi:MAG TPA: hypothetical protein V6C72_13955 [Chroococcales cyanobacterium]
MSEIPITEIEHHNLHPQELPIEIPNPLTMPELGGYIEKEQQIRRLIVAGLRYASLALVANMIGLAILAVLHHAFLAAKILMVEVMLGLALPCLLIALFSAQIMILLEEAELIANVLRDEAMFELQQQQLVLRGIREKLTGGEQVIEQAHISDLLQYVGPLAMMFFQREKSVVKWGMMGMQIAKNALNIWKQRTGSEH